MESELASLTPRGEASRPALDRCDRPVDEARLRQLMDGHPTARRWLYQELSGRLLRKLRQRYGRTLGLDVEDLLQDVFLFLFRRAPALFGRFVGDGRPAPTIAELDRFVWNQACGLVANYRRSSRLRPTVAGVDVFERSDGLDEEQHLLHRDQCARIGRALQAGDAKLYLYFKLRFVEGLSPAEICAVTAWPRRDVYNLRLRLERAVQRIVDKGRA